MNFEFDKHECDAYNIVVMAQNSLEKLNRNIYDLRKEMGILRSFIIGCLGKDREGEYRPDFVRKVIKSVSEDTPLVFKDKKSFLKRIQN